MYIDFANKFDKCEHKAIAHKLRQNRIIGKLGRWIYNFLISGAQTTKNNHWFFIILVDIDKDQVL